jgi:Leucine-rich repeat (LRR) protein
VIPWQHFPFACPNRSIGAKRVWDLEDGNFPSKFSDSSHFANTAEIVSKVDDDEIDELVLAGLGITDETLPLEIFNLDLISLDLSNNQITKLPNAISKMNMLEKLDISDNSLYSLPRDFSRLTALKKVGTHTSAAGRRVPQFLLPNPRCSQFKRDISTNPVYSCSSELSGNKFSSEVETIVKCWLKREESLDLSKRELRHLCPEIRVCGDHLRELILDDNQLSSLPEDIGLLVKLERLSIQRNSLVALDWEVAQCTKLVSLDLSGNKVKRVASETTALVDLVELFLSSNELGTVPPALFSLDNLEILTLSKNGISSIPSLIFNLRRLKQLDLSNNQISIIPREVCMLPKLKKLNLKNNKVSEIPIFISELGALTDLDLTNNELSYIYNDLGALANLTALKLGNNRLAEVSSTVGLMTGLQKLVLKGNERLRSPAPDVAKQGTSKVMEALSKSAGKRFVRDEFMRLVVVGDPGVGKSCLLSCLRTQNPDTTAPRAGKYGLALDDWTLVIVDEKTDDETLIKFETWDVSTPRELMEAQRVFFTNRTIFVVACKIDNTDVLHWIDLIRSKVSDPSIFVVATHCDSSSTEESVKMMANRYSGDVVGTFGVSCKKGTNVQRLVAAITKHCLHVRSSVLHLPPALWSNSISFCRIVSSFPHIFLPSTALSMPALPHSSSPLSPLLSWRSISKTVRFKSQRNCCVANVTCRTTLSSSRIPMLLTRTSLSATLCGFMIT